MKDLVSWPVGDATRRSEGGGRGWRGWPGAAKTRRSQTKNKLDGQCVCTVHWLAQEVDPAAFSFTLWPVSVSSAALHPPSSIFISLPLRRKSMLATLDSRKATAAPAAHLPHRPSLFLTHLTSLHSTCNPFGYSTALDILCQCCALPLCAASPFVFPLHAFVFSASITALATILTLETLTPSLRCESTHHFDPLSTTAATGSCQTISGRIAVFVNILYLWAKQLCLDDILLDKVPHALPKHYNNGSGRARGLLRRYRAARSEGDEQAQTLCRPFLRPPTDDIV